MFFDRNDFMPTMTQRVVKTCKTILYIIVQDGFCDLSDVSYLVLDEADRMLDQGILSLF